MNWLSYVDVCTNDLANSTVIPTENKNDYSVALLFDNLQDIIEKMDSGIVAALQTWRDSRAENGRRTENGRRIRKHD